MGITTKVAVSTSCSAAVSAGRQFTASWIKSHQTCAQAVARGWTEEQWAGNQEADRLAGEAALKHELDPAAAQQYLDGRPVLFKVKSMSTFTGSAVNPTKGHLTGCQCRDCAV